MTTFVPSATLNSNCNPSRDHKCFLRSNSGRKLCTSFRLSACSTLSCKTLPLAMSAKANPNPPSFDELDKELNPTSAPLNLESEDTFVFDDELHFPEREDQPQIIWNRLPIPSTLFESYRADLTIVSTIIAIIYGLVRTTGSLYSSTPYASLTIDTSLRVLPWYAAQSLTRMLAGYTVSLVFSLAYAYVAYRVRFAAKILMLVIDVLQSIPLLSFLPGVVLGLIAIFPGARIGVELAAVLLLFTSMAWNMLLGFYQSLCCIPHDLVDVAKTFRLTPWKRFWTLELPAGAIGLVWNSVISVAGGWFFLISIESFELGNRDFKLPGLGSYLAVAAQNSDTFAILAGLIVVIAIIVVIDFLIWRPLIAWSTKFTYGGSHADDGRSRSMILDTLQRSKLVRSIHSAVFAPAWEAFVNLRLGELPELRGAKTDYERQNVDNIRGEGDEGQLLDRDSSQRGQQPAPRFGIHTASATIGEVTAVILAVVRPLIVAAVAGGVGYCLWQSLHLLESISVAKWVAIGTAALATFGRVVAALLLSLLWTVPAGIAIGRNRDLAAKVQPIVQVAASVPATALFPFVLLFLAKLGGGLQVGSVALMMLGTMWYVLFNVIAGAQAIPSELFEVDAVYNKDGRWKRWRSLLLPGIFPYLITGVVTAVGGAWNASIVSEYVVFQGGIMKTHGLGALISEAAASGDYVLLLAGTVVMSLLVLLTNRFVWRPLYRLAETKYRI
eukprot:GFKZ01001224.1.p1 GENE.GFKZ01001224.1~~GFKZ01001224.1.p1  ORF type:complete len:725 (-),score=56.18 GFKZ01001224.1:1501-3675(-)